MEMSSVNQQLRTQNTSQLKSEKSNPSTQQEAPKNIESESGVKISISQEAQIAYDNEQKEIAAVKEKAVEEAQEIQRIVEDKLLEENVILAQFE